MLGSLLRSLTSHSGADESPHHAGGTGVWHATLGDVLSASAAIPLVMRFWPAAPIPWSIALAAAITALAYSPKEWWDWRRGADRADWIMVVLLVAVGASAAGVVVFGLSGSMLHALVPGALMATTGLVDMAGTTIKRNRK